MRVVCRAKHFTTFAALLNGGDGGGGGSGGSGGGDSRGGGRRIDDNPFDGENSILMLHYIRLFSARQIVNTTPIFEQLLYYFF